MAQYVKIILKVKSDDAPDWGNGQGVLASFIGKLQDDDTIAGMQINQLKEDIIYENVEAIAEPSTEKEFNKEE